MISASKIVTQFTGTLIFGGFAGLLLVLAPADPAAYMTFGSAFAVNWVLGGRAKSAAAHFGVLALSFCVVMGGIKLFGKTVETKYSCGGNTEVAANVQF